MAVCFDAPVVELFEERAEALHPPLAGLGPDILAPEFDAAEAIRRLREPARAERSIAEALLDQRALAGIGNIYKNETLWIDKVSPFSVVAEVDEATLNRLVATARRLMLANASPGRGPERITTAGDRTATGALYVYGRTGRPCRRCGTPIRSIRQGTDLPRTTYWCPTCQPTARCATGGGRGKPGQVASARMCEHFIARAAEPFRLDEIWPFAERLERFGVAGFGWGVSWLAADGRLHGYRDVRAFRDDPGRATVGSVETTSALVHLRRPSRLSTLTLADTQPFADPAGRYAFSHNGDLADYRSLRATYRGEGRIHGRADTEVAARWLEDAWRDEAPVPEVLGALHDRFRGQANLAVLAADGTPHHYAGNTENPVFAFRMGRIGVVSTGIYSLDRSLFRYVAPGATDRQLLRQHTTASLDRNGIAITAS